MNSDDVRLPLRSGLCLAVAVAGLTACGADRGAEPRSPAASSGTDTVIPVDRERLLDAGSSKCTLKVFIRRDATRRQINAILEEVRRDKRVVRVRFVTSTARLAELRAKFPDLVDSLDSNPLPHEVRLTPRRRSEIPQLVDDLRALGLPGVAHIACTKF
jgi:hypothetical protein